MKVIEKFKLCEDEKLLLSHETEIMLLLNHPCIIKMFDKVETMNHMYIITELVNDGDLFDYIQHRNYLKEEEAALLMS